MGRHHQLPYMPEGLHHLLGEAAIATGRAVFHGRGGITPPGGNNGAPADYVCSTGASAGTNDLTAAQKACGGGASSVWFPDLRKSQAALSMGIMVKF